MVCGTQDICVICLEEVNGKQSGFWFAFQCKDPICAKSLPVYCKSCMTRMERMEESPKACDPDANNANLTQLSGDALKCPICKKAPKVTRNSIFASFFSELTPKQIKALEKSRAAAKKCEASRKDADFADDGSIKKEYEAQFQEKVRDGEHQGDFEFAQELHELEKRKPVGQDPESIKADEEMARVLGQDPESIKADEEMARVLEKEWMGMSGSGMPVIDVLDEDERIAKRLEEEDNKRDMVAAKSMSEGRCGEDRKGTGALAKGKGAAKKGGKDATCREPWVEIRGKVEGKGESSKARVGGLGSGIKGGLPIPSLGKGKGSVGRGQGDSSSKGEEQSAGKGKGKASDDECKTKDKEKQGNARVESSEESDEKDGKYDQDDDEEDMDWDQKKRKRPTPLKSPSNKACASPGGVGIAAAGDGERSSSSSSSVRQPVKILHIKPKPGSGPAGVGDKQLEPELSRIIKRTVQVDSATGRSSSGVSAGGEGSGSGDSSQDTLNKPSISQDTLYKGVARSSAGGKEGARAKYEGVNEGGGKAKGGSEGGKAASAARQEKDKKQEDGDEEEKEKKRRRLALRVDIGRRMESPHAHEEFDRAHKQPHLPHSPYSSSSSSSGSTGIPDLIPALPKQNRSSSSSSSFHAKPHISKKPQSNIAKKHGSAKKTLRVHSPQKGLGNGPCKEGVKIFITSDDEGSDGNDASVGQAPDAPSTIVITLD